MSTKRNFLIQIAGRFTIGMGAALFLLFLANLRSRLYYHGPDYGFLLWMCLYCIFTGIGLLKCRKWAVLLLFLPGIVFITIYTVGLTRGARVAMPWALVNYSFLAVVLGIPALMLRNWRELRW